jgi:hypothetical protein
MELEIKKTDVSKNIRVLKTRATKSVLNFCLRRELIAYSRR